MEHDGIGNTILSAIRQAPVEFNEKLKTQKSFDIETLASPEKETKHELRRTDSDPGPPTTAKSEEARKEADGGEGRERSEDAIQKDLICIKAESKAERTKKDDPKIVKDVTDRRKTLLRAVCKDDAETVQMILKDTPDLVDFCFPFTHGYTPLHYAAKGGHRRVAQILLASGANIGAKTTFHYTAHHLAAMADDLEMIDILDAVLPEDKQRHLSCDLSGKTFEDYLEESDRLQLHHSQLSLCRSSPSPLPPKDSLTPGDSSFSRFGTVRRTVGKFFAREGTPTKK